MKKSVVKSIGKNAIHPKDPLIILFDESATDALKNVSVIQKFDELNDHLLKAGDTLSFDEQEYKITQVGPLANENLQAMGHVTVVFKEFTAEDEMANALYVEPFILPEIIEGTVITYAIK